MEQFSQFNIEKQAAIASLEQMSSILGEFAALGIDVHADVTKIRGAIASVESDVLRIALLGAFSDGKTSVVAAWLGRLMDDMKIDMDESSDRLTTYRPLGLEGECEIIDTPGLFGDREKAVDGDVVMYEELTKRYISEAHLIFYVVDATNPLKESHSEVVRWVLRDLNKLPSTIFVINKMDEVTDLTEPELFAQQAAIKKENLTAKLCRIAALTPAEAARLSIVCIASNPNGRGLEFWFGKPEQYASRSRIGDLKSATSTILRQNTAGELITKAGLDVVRDLAQKRLADAENELAKLVLFEDQNREESKRIEQDISTGRAEVKRLAGELRRELEAMEKQLLAKLRPLSLEQIQAFLEDEIGFSGEDVGYKLNLKIKGAIDHLFDQSSAVVNRISLDIERQLKSSESFLDAVGEGAMKSVSGAFKGVSKLDPALIKASIFAARDLLKNVTGIAIKFKPWEASKLAGAVSKWAGPAGALLSLGSDFYKMYKEHDQEQKLTQLKKDIGDAAKLAFKDIYDLLASDEKMLAFFAPQLAEFEEVAVAMAESAELIRSNREKVLHVKTRLDAIELPGHQHLPKP